MKEMGSDSVQLGLIGLQPRSVSYLVVHQKL
jgi:hypothetical protein